MRFGVLVVDPPGGWKYGFPKVCPLSPTATEEDFNRWYLSEGYPKSEIKNINWGRSWYQQIDVDLLEHEKIFDKVQQDNV